MMFKTKKHNWGPRPGLSDYLHPKFFSLLDASSISVIFEIGCKDGKDSVLLCDYLDAQVYAFECNPDMLPHARKRLLEYSKIRLVEGAVWDENGEIPFFPVVHATEDGRPVINYGASSCFRARDDYRRRYVQREVNVSSMTLDHFCGIEGGLQVDLICMDVQGAALRVLRGADDMLQSVRWVISEIEHKPIYENQDLFPEVDDFLKSKGFELVASVPRDDWFSDFMYFNPSADASNQRLNSNE